MIVKIIQEFMRIVNRVKSFALAAVEIGQFVQSCFAWESPVRSSIAFLIFLISVYCCELYMLPLLLLLLFLKSYVQKSVVEGYYKAKEEDETYYDSDDDEELGDDKVKKGSDRGGIHTWATVTGQHNSL